MTEAASSGGIRGGVHHTGTLTPSIAIRVAWAAWMFLLVVPFFVFLWTVMMLDRPDNRPPQLLATDVWFEISLIYLLVVVPVSFFWRGHIFRAYWTGQPVSPWKYLIGTLSVWFALEIGGIFSLFGCFYNHSLLPDLLPALVAFMFFVTLWPSGRAMINHMKDVEDPELYEEPR
jgi:hypothetical protein